MTDKDFMKQAVALARGNMNANRGGPFGAVVVKDGRIVGRGANNVTSLNDPTAHAEIMAIREACAALNDFSLQGCAIYSSCEPCPMCLAAIYWARIETVYYANTRQDAAKIAFDDEFLYEQVALPPPSRSLKCIHTPDKDALSVFADWDKKTDKIAY